MATTSCTSCKFQKLFNDRGDIISKFVHTTSFPRNQKQHCSVEIAYTSCKNLRVNFDKSAEKINGRLLFPSPHVTACDFIGFVESFFLKLSTTIFPLYGPSRSIEWRKPFRVSSCKKVTELPNWSSSLIGQIFLPNQRDGIRPLLELVL